MANKKGRRQFGNIRKLPSGRYQASYLGRDGIRYNAPNTFPTKADAAAWLTIRWSELLKGEWASPSGGKVLFGDYAENWVKDRELGERTRGKYQTLLRLHVAPHLGKLELAEITTETIRRWLTQLRNGGLGASTRAGAYRLVRAVMNTAVDDERIKRNPCRVKGADKETADERPVASISQVFDLADAVPERYMALVLAAAFTSLRWGELAGLRRADIDLVERVVHVRRKLMQLDDGRLVEGKPKSAASKRKVSIPSLLVDGLQRHLDEFVRPGARARVFTRGSGRDLRRDCWHADAGWRDALKVAGLPKGFRFHDLRHTGNHLIAQSGANLREMMRRMGHSSVRAAMIYQHATDERDREIADKLAGLVDRYRRGQTPDSTDGPDDDGDDAADALAPTG